MSQSYNKRQFRVREITGGPHRPPPMFVQDAQSYGYEAPPSPRGTYGQRSHPTLETLATSPPHVVQETVAAQIHRQQTAEHFHPEVHRSDHVNHLTQKQAAHNTSYYEDIQRRHANGADEGGSNPGPTVSEAFAGSWKAVLQNGLKLPPGDPLAKPAPSTARPPPPAYQHVPLPLSHPPSSPSNTTSSNPERHPPPRPSEANASRSSPPRASSSPDSKTMVVDREEYMALKTQQQLAMLREKDARTRNEHTQQQEQHRAREQELVRVATEKATEKQQKQHLHDLQAMEKLQEFERRLRTGVEERLQLERQNMEQEKRMKQLQTALDDAMDRWKQSTTLAVSSIEELKSTIVRLKGEKKELEEYALGLEREIGGRDTDLVRPKVLPERPKNPAPPVYATQQPVGQTAPAPVQPVPTPVQPAPGPVQPVPGPVQPRYTTQQEFMPGAHATYTGQPSSYMGAAASPVFSPENLDNHPAVMRAMQTAKTMSEQLIANAVAAAMSDSRNSPAMAPQSLQSPPPRPPMHESRSTVYHSPSTSNAHSSRIHRFEGLSTSSIHSSSPPRHDEELRPTASASAMMDRGSEPYDMEELERKYASGSGSASSEPPRRNTIPFEPAVPNDAGNEAAAKLHDEIVQKVLRAEFNGGSLVPKAIKEDRMAMLSILFDESHGVTRERVAKAMGRLFQGRADVPQDVRQDRAHTLELLFNL